MSRVVLPNEAVFLYL